MKKSVGVKKNSLDGEGVVVNVPSMFDDPLGRKLIWMLIIFIGCLSAPMLITLAYVVVVGFIEHLRAAVLACIFLGVLLLAAGGIVQAYARKDEQKRDREGRSEDEKERLDGEVKRLRAQLAELSNGAPVRKTK